MQFKDFLIEKFSDVNVKNEADIVLHQIINNVDDSHVDYDESRLDFNVGILVKRSDYSRLFFTIFNDKSESVALAKNNKKDGYTIVINTSKFPSRLDIDKFLSSPEMYNKVKSQVQEFIENHSDKLDKVVTSYESNKQINTDKNFEKLYTVISNSMKDKVKEYKEISSDIKTKLETTANEAEKQTLIRSLEKLKDEYFGTTFKRFKKLAVEAVDIDLTRLQKEYKKKLDTRLENFYEYITKI